MPRLSRLPRTSAALLGGLTLTLAACSSGGGVERENAQDVQLVASLTPVTSCDALLDHLHEEAAERVGPYGFGGAPAIMEGAGGGEGDDVANFESESAADAAGAPALPSSPRQTETAGPEVSSTNVQEAGVDEPDIVKADGERILAVAQGRLHWIDVTGDEPVLAGSVDLPDGLGAQLLVQDDRALVLVGSEGVPVPLQEDGVASSEIAPIPTDITSTLAEVDVSAPDALEVLDTWEVDGSILDARMVGGVARVVVTSQPPGLGFVYPSDGSEEALEAAEAANRELVRSTTLEDWLPGSSASDGPLVPCERMELPSEFSGFGTLAVLTHDLNGDFAGFSNEKDVGILADGEHVYASADRLYVATTEFPDVAEDPAPNTDVFIPSVASTAIHRFSIDGTEGARYEMSGVVRGRLLDQFSMSELGDALRVATTDDEAQESFVTVLGPSGDELTEIGQVGGMGEGEQIYSVRFIGEVGYVVTFRQTDPLYTVDLSDPANPTVTGELELLGYSSYLHPAGDGLLLGVGQEADANGVISGLQLSLFDVSDPANPTRLQQLSVPGATSDAEYDHHAFLFWPETGLAVLPVQRWSDTSAESFTGALGFHIDPEAIERVGQVIHDDGSALTRSVVIRDDLFTLSDTSLVASRLDNLLQESVVPLS